MVVLYGYATWQARSDPDYAIWTARIENDRVAEKIGMALEKELILDGEPALLYTIYPPGRASAEARER
jgi:hypothetical protein